MKVRFPDYITTHARTDFEFRSRRIKWMGLSRKPGCTRLQTERIVLERHSGGIRGEQALRVSSTFLRYRLSSIWILRALEISSVAMIDQELTLPHGRV